MREPTQAPSDNCSGAAGECDHLDDETHHFLGRWPGLTSITGNGCDPSFTVSGNTASIVSGSTCTLTNATTGQRDFYTFQTNQYTVNGNTMTSSETATDQITFSNGTSGSCQASTGGNATKQ